MWIEDDLEREELNIEKEREDAIDKSLREWELDQPALKEIERYHQASDRISRLESLKPDIWKEKNEIERKWILDNAGRELSKVYHTPKPGLFPEENESSKYGSYDDENWRIKINRDELVCDDPRKALRTYCHEFRHSYQMEQALSFEKGFSVDNPQEAKEWAENYIQPPDDKLKTINPEQYRKKFSEYENQPIEADARKFVDQIVERVFKKL